MQRASRTVGLGAAGLLMALLLQLPAVDRILVPETQELIVPGIAIASSALGVIVTLVSAVLLAVGGLGGRSIPPPAAVIVSNSGLPIIVALGMLGLVLDSEVPGLVTVSAVVALTVVLVGSAVAAVAIAGADRVGPSSRWIYLPVALLDLAALVTTAIPGLAVASSLILFAARPVLLAVVGAVLLRAAAAAAAVPDRGRRRSFTSERRGRDSACVGVRPPLPRLGVARSHTPTCGRPACRVATGALGARRARLLRVTPHDALAEIAFRLERDRAEPFRIQAFRRAAAAIDGLSTEELAARSGDGRLKAMKGIGGRSLEVVQQALAGEVPAYLAALRAQSDADLSPEGRALLGRLRGDLHTHSEWSDGTTPINAMVEAAAMLGREYLALTDHSRGLRVANGLSEARLTEQLEVVAGFDGPVRLLPGIEVDVLEDGTLDQEPALLDRLDVVVASLHGQLRGDTATITRRLLGAIADPHTNVIGHITGRLVEGRRGTRPQSQFDAERVFAAAAEAGVAIEINSRPERQDPPDELIAQALDAGCLFSIDTDAHAPGHLDLLGLGASRAAAAGIPDERIVTTWPVERLLEWTHARR